VDFSIVIPARDSAKTLRYTLQTCLNQRYTGSYEIVVSDNSVEENSEIYSLCKELNHPKIRYIKTPRSLYLTKSFEFAYLQARGEFVFSIGSDDGVLPWALDVLKLVLDRFPKEEIVQWDRGFYAWPGFNGGQENMFQIPRKYEKGSIDVYYDSTKEILNRVAQNLQAIYTMPLFYINSGFRRSYFKTLLKKTGKLLDGTCQDLSTGIINCCINKQILCLVYPLTIAGMNTASVGYLVNTSDTKMEQNISGDANRKLFQLDNAGITVLLARERLMHQMSGDMFALYIVLSRAVDEGLLSAEKSDAILDWQTAVSKSISFYPMLKDNYDCFIHSARFMAKKVGKKAHSWFEGMYPFALKPNYWDESRWNEERRKKSYQEENNPDGGVVLDASRFDVCDIAQAVGFFADSTGL